MKRTVSKVGPATLVISLPSKWAKKHSVNKGDLVNLTEAEEGLLISLSANPKEKKLELDVSDYVNRTIINILNNAYRSGYTTIILKYKDQQQSLFINGVVREKLLGFEVLDDQNSKSIIQNIAEPSSEQIEPIIRKLFLLTKQVASSIEDDIANGLFENFKRIEVTKSTIDNFTNFCRRTINKETYTGKTKSYFLWSFIARLSLVFHSYYYMYQNALNNSKIINSSFATKTIKEINEVFEVLYLAFYKKDYGKLNDIDKKRKNIQKEVFKEMKESKDTIFLFYCAELARNIQMASTFLFGKYLN